MAFSYRQILSKEHLENASDEEMDELISSHPRFSRHKNSIVGDARIMQPRHRHKSPSINSDFILEEEEGNSEDDSLKNINPNLPIQFGCLGNNDDSEASDSLSLSSARPIKFVRFRIPEYEEIPKDFSKPYNLSDSIANPHQTVKLHVKEVTGVMKHNTSRLLEREAQLDALDMTGDFYFQHSQLLRRKMKWRQLRMNLGLGVMCLVGILLFLFPTIRKFIGRYPNST